MHLRIYSFEALNDREKVTRTCTHTHIHVAADVHIHERVGCRGGVVGLRRETALA